MQTQANTTFLGSMMGPTHRLAAARGASLAIALPVGCWLVWVVAREPCLDLARTWGTAGAGGIGALSFSQVLTGLCGWVVVVGSAWLSGTAILVTGVALAQTAVRRARIPRGCRALLSTPLDAAAAVTTRICPNLVQRLVVGCCGMVLGGGLGAGMVLVPAMAESGSADAAASTPVRGLGVPDRAVGTHLPTSSVAVRSGDSLWSISADHLPRTATDAEITAAWQELYRTNRNRVGETPHLIFPGTTLRVFPQTDLYRKGTP